MKNESPVTGSLKACLWGWRHKPFAEAQSSKGRRQVMSSRDPSCHVGVSPCMVSSTWWQSGQKTGGGKRYGPCAAEEEGICSIRLEAWEEVNLISFPLNSPCEAAYVATLIPALAWCRREARRLWALLQHPSSPSTETFLLLMQGVSNSTLYPSFSPIFHQKVSIQRTLKAYKSLPSP